MPVKTLKQRIKDLYNYVLCSDDLEKLDGYFERTIEQLSTIEEEISKVKAAGIKAEAEKKQAILDKVAAEKSRNEAQDLLQVKEKELERIASKSNLFDLETEKLQQEKQQLEAELKNKKREISSLEADKSNLESDIKDIIAAINGKFHHNISENSDALSLCMAIKRLRVLSPDMLEEIELQRNNEVAAAVAETAQWQQKAQEANATLHATKAQIKSVAAAFNSKFTEFPLPANADLPALAQALEQVEISTGIAPEELEKVEAELQQAQAAAEHQALMLNTKLSETEARLAQAEQEYHQAQATTAQRESQLNEQLAATAALICTFNQKFTFLNLPADADAATLSNAVEQVEATLQQAQATAEHLALTLNNQLSETEAKLAQAEEACSQAQATTAQRESQLNEQLAATAALTCAFNQKFTTLNLPANADLATLASALEQVEISTGIAPEALEKAEAELQQAQATISQQQTQLDEQRSEATALIAVFNAEFTEQAVPENADLTTLAAAISGISGTLQAEAAQQQQLQQALNDAAQNETRLQQQLNTLNRQSAELIKVFNEKFAENTIDENASLSVLTTELQSIELHNDINTEAFAQFEATIEQMSKSESSLRTQLSTMQADTMAAVNAFNNKFTNHAIPATATLAQLATAIERVTLEQQEFAPVPPPHRSRAKKKLNITEADHLLINAIKQMINGNGAVSQNSIITTIITTSKSKFSLEGLQQANELLTKEGKGRYSGVAATLKGKIKSLNA